MIARERVRLKARAIWACGLWLAVLLMARSASAHVMGLSRGDYTPRGAEVEAAIVLREDEAALAVPGLDANGDRRVSATELDRAQPALGAAFVAPLVVEADGARCAGAMERATLEAPDGIRVEATFRCPHEPAHLHLRFGFLDRLPSGHRHLATVHARAGDVDTLAVLARPDFEVDLGTSASSHGIGSLLRGGIEHILTGPDHLAFLLALVLGGTLAAPAAGAAGANGAASGRSRRLPVGALAAMLTAFTVGHSCSLALATLGGFAPGARLVEPAVALSVAYVGAENLFVKSVRHRWMLTLPFGFVHGFAFAGGLIPLGLPRAELPLALFAFNLGVEVGQLMVLGVILPPLAWFDARPWYPRFARGLSAAIGLAGLGWFIQRVA